MTKYALESLCDAMRLEVAPFGVRVVLIEPGAVRTEFLSNSARQDPVLAEPGVYETFKHSVAAMTRVAPIARRLLGDRGWDAAMRRLVPFPAPS
jgi:NAD(P)-dependent dehydrogenase (short-subunit alcohol dehydrogenase family)